MDSRVTLDLGFRDSHQRYQLTQIHLQPGKLVYHMSCVMHAHIVCMYDSSYAHAYEYLHTYVHRMYAYIHTVHISHGNIWPRQFLRFFDLEQ